MSGSASTPSSQSVTSFDAGLRCWLSVSLRFETRAGVPCAFLVGVFTATGVPSPRARTMQEPYPRAFGFGGPRPSSCDCDPHATIVLIVRGIINRHIISRGSMGRGLIGDGFATLLRCLVTRISPPSVLVSGSFDRGEAGRRRGSPTAADSTEPTWAASSGERETSPSSISCESRERSRFQSEISSKRSSRTLRASSDSIRRTETRAHRLHRRCHPLLPWVSG